MTFERSRAKVFARIAREGIIGGFLRMSRLFPKVRVNLTWSILAREAI
jgi:hypothetical protein